jgi:hypothetical protein
METSQFAAAFTDGQKERSVPLNICPFFPAMRIWIFDIQKQLLLVTRKMSWFCFAPTQTGRYSRLLQMPVEVI